MMDKPGKTIKPNRPVTERKPRKPLSISVDMDTDKLQLKLRAIAKHVEALADELDAIDNAELCKECGSYYGYVQNYLKGDEVIRQEYRCHECLAEYELPTRLEGSD